MSDTLDSSSKVQVEGQRFRSPVSESMLQSMGGAINFILDKLDPVGSYKWSDLTEAQFQAEIPTTCQEWVIADGRSVVGSAYQTKTGFTNIPDRRGHGMRAKNNGRADGKEDPAGDLAIGTYEGDTVANHIHRWYDTRGSSGVDASADNLGAPVSIVSAGVPTIAGSGIALSTPGFAQKIKANTTPDDLYTEPPVYISGTENRVKADIANLFVRIN